MTTATHAMVAWEPRRALTLKQARRRSRLIAVLRRVLVAAAGAALASVFVFMTLQGLESGFGRDPYGSAEPMRMINPRFTGRTEGGGAYQLTAEAAVREDGGRRLLDLTAPVYRALDGAIVVAPEGDYDEARELVALSGGVLFSDPSGNRFSTPDMQIDLETGTIQGARGVTGAGPLGVVRADAYELRQTDRAVVLRGGVRGQMPERGAEAAPASPPQDR